MKNIKNIALVFVGIVMLFSCAEEDTFISDIENSTNLAGFTNTVKGVSKVADGSDYVIPVKMKAFGPSTDKLNNDIILTITVDESSTAVEGTHYSLDNNTITLSKSNDYLGLFEFTMLTEGIVTPLAASPILVLNVSNVSGESNVVNSGKPIIITLNYACPSFLEGTYNVHTTRDDGGEYDWTETITNIGVGEYLTEYVGTWDPPLNADGYGFIFTDVCDVISVPQQGLADIYSNNVYGAAPGSVDPETGIITISYVIEFASGNVTYTSVYTPAK